VSKGNDIALRRFAAFAGRGELAGKVRHMLALLRSHGIALLDVHPGNIRFS
jgi:hypothetical protein